MNTLLALDAKRRQIDQPSHKSPCLFHIASKSSGQIVDESIAIIVQKRQAMLRPFVIIITS